MIEGAPVYYATTWKGGRKDHYRMYGVERSTPEVREAKRIFNGMDGISINLQPSTSVTGCISDIERNPEIIEGLVGPKGLAFLKELYLHARVHGFDIQEIYIVSSWQFSILTTSERSTVDIVLSALQNHLGLLPVRMEWVLW